MAPRLMVIDMGGQPLHAFGLPRTERENAERIGKVYRRETNYNTVNTEEERHKMEQNLEKKTNTGTDDSIQSYR